MKYIISEKQFSLIFEQAGLPIFGVGKTGEKNLDIFSKTIDPKLANTILQIGTAFIPIIGPYISMGFMGNEMMQDYKKASTNQAKSNIILSYVITMATAWGLGKIFKSIAELGEEGMKTLGKKMRSMYAWKALSTKESAVMLDLANGPQYWQEKLKSSIPK